MKVVRRNRIIYFHLILFLLFHMLGELTTIHDLCSDIWTNIFEYFEAIDLFTIFASITSAADQVLYNDFYGICFRAFTLKGPTTEIPAWVHMNRIISMTLYETTSIKVLVHCSELRSLKLVGEINWITSAIKTISQTSTKLSQLTIVTSVVTSLSKTLLPMLSIPSLRRLEIHLDEIVENTEVHSFFASSNSIEQLIFDSGTTINWNEFFKAAAKCISVRLLSIGLIDKNPLPITSFVFNNLRTLSLRLLEAPFSSIIQLLAITKRLVKLKLTGLSNEDGFVVNPRWNDLFEYTPTLSQVFVDLSLESYFLHSFMYRSFTIDLLHIFFIANIGIHDT